MLCGKNLILATRPYTIESKRTSWACAISTFVLLAAALAGALLAPYLILRILSSMVAGLLVVRFFIIYHDYEHHTILQKSLPAKIIMTIFGIYILAPASIWKRSHDYHHNHNSKLFTADIGSFPIVTKKQFQSMSKKDRMVYLAIRHPLNILFGYITIFIVGMCARSFISSPKKHYDSLIAIFIHIIGSILVIHYFGWLSWLLFVVVPLFIACGFGSYLFYAQHNFTVVTFKERKAWQYEIAAMESSSYMKMNKVMEWFTGNIGYHHIHHLNSRIPFYRLPEIMKDLPELQNAKTTSLNIREIISCLKLKVWDPEKNRMVGLREV
ncbi:MAG TPA: fatty acid desaturase [Puia sp.]|nr:fatty acid desaturase [Puia sp.]